MRSLLLLLACTSAMTACCGPAFHKEFCNLGPIVPPPPSDVPTTTRAEPAPRPPRGTDVPCDFLGDRLMGDMRAALVDMASAQERFGPPGEAPPIATSLRKHRGETSPGTIVCDGSVYQPDSRAPAAPEAIIHATHGCLNHLAL